MQRATASNAIAHRTDDPFAHLGKIAGRAVGLDLELPVATGKTTRRVYLDSTATTLRLDVVQHVLDRYQRYYANTHSTVHFAAKLSTREYDWAHAKVLEFVRADAARYSSFFVGSGTTGGMNRVARTLSRQLPGRDVVITSIMEHHSNDLPHRKHFREVVHVPLEAGDSSMGCIDIGAMERALEAHKGRVAYVAITGVSNVTGIINPVHEIAQLAHRHGALIVIDGAQMVAHMPITMSGHDDPTRDLDVLVFSGHKIYAPGSPGVVVARTDLLLGLEPDEVGGGMVDVVHTDRYVATAKMPDREEAGTPNIPGAIGLAAALHALDQVGMDVVFHDECELMDYALRNLAGLAGIAIYGDTDLVRYPRAGAISFNVSGMHHALTAAILNDYFNIAVRNECFCAHPYVREMVAHALAQADADLSNAQLEALAEMQRGMVRASFGVYSTRADVDFLLAALTDVLARRSYYEAQYDIDADGSYRHKTFSFDSQRLFSIESAVADWLAQP